MSTPQVYGRHKGDVLWAPLKTKKTNSKHIKPVGVKCKSKPSDGPKDWAYTVNIILPHSVEPDSKIIYWAAKSGQYNDAEAAYNKTKNKGVVLAKDGVAQFNIQMPSPYTEGNKLYTPHVHFKFCDGNDLWSATLHNREKKKKKKKQKIKRQAFVPIWIKIVLFLAFTYLAYQSWNCRSLDLKVFR